MTEQDWKQLHAWLLRVFGADQGAQMYAEHLADARRMGLPLPSGEPIFVQPAKA